ncbi:MAG TPA: hypothetical protein PLL57_07825 [Flavobacteriales bacterium]|nr:hypothetical protein [Flavobacteriales bacterium]
MRQLLLPVLLLLHVEAYTATTNEQLLVHFAKDRSELTAEAIAALDTFLDRCQGRCPARRWPPRTPSLTDVR